MKGSKYHNSKKNTMVVKNPTNYRSKQL